MGDTGVIIAVWVLTNLGVHVDYILKMLYILICSSTSKFYMKVLYCQYMHLGKYKVPPNLKACINIEFYLNCIFGRIDIASKRHR